MMWDISMAQKARMQSAFDEFMKSVTGGTADIELSSHGRAFVAGWLAALESVSGVVNQMHDAESLRSSSEGLGREAKES